MKGKQLGIWVALLAEVLILTVLTSSFGGPHCFDSTFLSWSNLSQVFKAVSFIAIMAVGQSVVIISGGIDLSVGSVLGLSGVVTAVLLNGVLGVESAAIAGVAVGLVCGIATGLLITKANLPPFIATLGMMSVARGFAFALTGGETIRNLPEPFLMMGQGSIMNIPIPILTMVVFALVIGFLLKKTRLGR